MGISSEVELRLPIQGYLIEPKSTKIRNQRAAAIFKSLGQTSFPNREHSWPGYGAPPFQCPLPRLQKWIRWKEDIGETVSPYILPASDIRVTLEPTIVT